MLINLENRRLYYDLNGPSDGPVVCMTHSLTSDAGMWAEQLPTLLSAGFRVLRLDMRGHGGSDAATGDYTMDGLSDDVAIALQFLGIEKVHYVGLSIGGMIGQAFAIKHGDRLLSAMFCDTMPATPEGADGAWGPRRDAVGTAASVAPLADGTMERWFTPAFKPSNARRWSEIHATISGTTVGGYLGCTAAILNFDFTAQLPSVKTPTLVVCGSDDEGTPPSANRRISELIPDARYEEIANARHFPNVEHPGVFNEHMMKWLKQQG
ncbi:MAG: alpha/beta fold hydrolase [Hyphomicrobiaceae bacterium]